MSSLKSKQESTLGIEPSRCRFLSSVPNWTRAPETGLPEVAVAGRSNVGKSTLVNFLLGRRHLARTSSTPGRTQALNFFQVGDRFVLVDLPGYGYAAAPKAEVARWRAGVKAYLASRGSLKAVMLLLDIRRDPSPDDLAFCRLVRSSARRLLPVVTKADEVPRGHRLNRLKAIATAVGVEMADLIVTSARRREGRGELMRRVLESLETAREARCLVVAIDGPSGAGKSTVARRVADRLAWKYIDTGAMYRSIGLKADRLGIPLDDDPALEALCRETVLDLEPRDDGSLRVILDGEDVSEAIREHRVSSLASRVSARRPVREAMARFQRQLGCASPSVLEGRDIGTVVFPDAPVKVFLTATDEERAARRTRELHARGQQANGEDVLRDIRRRDADDSSREHAPLRAAPDARRVDTTGLTAEEVADRIVALVHEVL